MANYEAVIPWRGLIKKVREAQANEAVIPWRGLIIRLGCRYEALGQASHCDAPTGSMHMHVHVWGVAVALA